MMTFWLEICCFHRQDQAFKYFPVHAAASTNKVMMMLRGAKNIFRFSIKQVRSGQTYFG